MQKTTIRKMTKTLNFYKEKGIWYADLPLFLALGLGNKTNLMMVDGSDTFLDLLSRNGNKVKVKISTQPFKGHDIVLEKLKFGMDKNLLDRLGHAPVDYGAYYNVSKYNQLPFNHTLWLCPVTEFVFEGAYPQEIYLQLVQRK